MTDEIFDDIYYDEIGMCGCGQPHDVQVLLFELMQNHKNYNDNLISYEEMAAIRKSIIINTDSDIIFEFIFHVLDNAELLEHGTSIYSAWLTDKGNDFFNILKRQVTTEDENEY